MSDMLSNIGQFLGSDTGKGVLGAGAAGGGFLQNWLAQREATKKQQFIENLISNPAKFNQFVANFQKPLSQGLTSDIARQTDAYGAERGLGSSGPIMKDVYAQALAPYEQNAQQMALNAALQSLGIYQSSPTTKPVDITGLLKALQMGGSPSPNVTAGINPAAVPNPGPDISTLLSGPMPLPNPTVSGGSNIGDLSDSGGGAF